MKLSILLMIISIIFGCQNSQSSHLETTSTFLENIGTMQFSWVDSLRVDEYYGGKRIINAQVWYPSESLTSQVKSQYYYKIDSVWEQLHHWSESDFNLVDSIETLSSLNAPIKRTKKYPLIIYSPSLGGNLSQYTYYAEHLAGRGFMVMGINHLYESEYVINEFGTAIPSNLAFHDSLKTLIIPDQITSEAYREVKGARQKVLGQDIIFGLNKLLTSSQFKHHLDTSKIGAFGHSIGGAGVIYASMLDKRIKTVINLDGTPPTYALERGLSIPFLFIEDLTDYENHIGYAKLHRRRNEFCEINKDDSWRILISGANHNSFLDTNYFLETDPNEKRKALNILKLTSNYMHSFYSNYLNESGEFYETKSSDTVEVWKFVNK